MEQLLAQPGPLLLDLGSCGRRLSSQALARMRHHRPVSSAGAGAASRLKLIGLEGGREPAGTHGAETSARSSFLLQLSQRDAAERWSNGNAQPPKVAETSKPSSRRRLRSAATWARSAVCTVTSTVTEKTSAPEKVRS